MVYMSALCSKAGWISSDSNGLTFNTNSEAKSTLAEVAMTRFWILPPGSWAFPCFDGPPSSCTCTLWSFLSRNSSCSYSVIQLETPYWTWQVWKPDRCNRSKRQRWRSAEGVIDGFPPRLKDVENFEKRKQEQEVRCQEKKKRQPVHSCETHVRGWNAGLIKICSTWRTFLQKNKKTRSHAVESCLIKGLWCRDLNQ